MANEPNPQLNCGRPLGSKDITPRKMRNVQSHALEEHTNGIKEIDLKPQVDELVIPKEEKNQTINF